MSNSFIWPIDRTLSGATTPGQSGPGSNGNERVLHISQSSSITEASPSDCLMSYPGHLLVGCLTPLQTWGQCISQPQLIGAQDTRWGVGGILRMQLMYFTASADWATGPSWGDLIPLQRCSQWILQPQLIGSGALPFCRDAVGVFHSPSWLGLRTHVKGILRLYRDAVGEFYCPSWLGHWTLAGGRGGLRDAVDVFHSPSWLCHRTLLRWSYPSTEMQSMNFIAPADWATGHSWEWGALPFCRDAVHVFHSSSWLGHWTLVGARPYPSTEMQSVYFKAPADWANRTPVEGILPLYGDAVGVFYSPSWLGCLLIEILRIILFNLSDSFHWSIHGIYLMRLSGRFRGTQLFSQEIRPCSQLHKFHRYVSIF